MYSFCHIPLDKYRIDLILRHYKGMLDKKYYYVADENTSEMLTLSLFKDENGNVILDYCYFVTE